MIKRAFIAALGFVAASTAFAQESVQSAGATESVEYSTDKYKVETNSFWDNWFISIGAGGQVYFGDHDKQVSFGERISPALDIAVGKWFSPEIGVRLMYNGLSAKGAAQDVNGMPGPHASADAIDGKPWDGYWLRNQKFNYFNFQADAMFNLSNIFCGYNEKRVYNCSPYIGLGVMKVTDAPKETAVSGHFGILNSFRLCSALDLNLDLRGTLVDDDFDGEPGGRGGEGMFSATIGLTYKFKPRGWNRSRTIVREVYNNDEINAMREKLKQMSEENARLEEALAQNDRERAQTIVKQITSANLIVFPIGESTLSNQARVNLGMLAEVIKQGDASTVYTITGYADAGTGSKEMNEQLSKARAEAVCDCLVKEFGVNKSQLKIDYKGGVDMMLYVDPRMSSAVITTSN